VSDKTQLIDIEHDSTVAANFAHIASTLIENLFNDESLKVLHPGDPKVKDAYRCSPADVDAILFAIFETHRIVRRIRSDIRKMLDQPAETAPGMLLQ
jgi:hypothetical protein